MRSYDAERRYVGNLTRDLALINYEKSLKVARMLKLDKTQAEDLTRTLDNVLGFIPFVNK